MWISLLYPGTFSAILIIIPRWFHCEFHHSTWALSLQISLLYPGDFIANFITNQSLRYHLCLVHLYQICYHLGLSLHLPHLWSQMLINPPLHKLRQFCTYYSMKGWSHVSSLLVANMLHSELPYANKAWTIYVHMPQHHFTPKAQDLPFSLLVPTTM